MDYGLTSVHQGVSKAIDWERERKRGDAAALGGLGIGGASLYGAGKLALGAERSGHQINQLARQAAAANDATKFAPAAQAARRSMNRRAAGAGALAGLGLVALGATGGGAAASNEADARQLRASSAAKKRKAISKASKRDREAGNRMITTGAGLGAAGAGLAGVEMANTSRAAGAYNALKGLPMQDPQGMLHHLAGTSRTTSAVSRANKYMLPLGAAVAGGALMTGGALRRTRKDVRKQTVAKADYWYPSGKARRYDPEESRLRRMDAASGALGAASGLGGAALLGAAAVDRSKSKPIRLPAKAASAPPKWATGPAAEAALKAKRNLGSGAVRAAKIVGGNRGKIVAGTAATALGAAGINHHRNTSGRSYAPRYWY